MTFEPTPAAVEALVEVAHARLDGAAADDPDGLHTDRQQRALDRLHHRDTPECGHRCYPHTCTRPHGHNGRHATACGTILWAANDKDGTNA